MRPAAAKEFDPGTSVRPQAYTVAVFMRTFGLGKTKVYDEIRAGQLRAVRCGRRVLILENDAQAWAAALPPLSPKAEGPK